MKKTIYILIFLNVSILNVLTAQNIIREKGILKNKKELNELLNSEFSKIITGNSFSNFGRSVSVSTTDKTLKISGTTIDSLTIWSYNISGGANNGAASLFNGLDLNTNVGGEFTFNKIINL